MHRFLSFLLILLVFSAKAFPQSADAGKQLPEICISQAEQELYRLINEYRVQKGLPAVEISASLCFVAQTHARDQAENFNQGQRCNMHSWSDKGKWSPCCYTPDHKKAKCMWDKPRELTGYLGEGFEISFFSTYQYNTLADQAKDILAGWKKSVNHNDVIINKNIWKKMEWKAIGVGIYGGYADVWFGSEPDPAGKPKPCAE